MKTFNTRKEVTEAIQLLRNQGKTIGFVPTMGALHLGHLSLIKESKKENDITVVSIFVNPIQFNNSQDLKSYPRTIETDSKQLQETGADILFYPDEKEIYPDIPTEKYEFGQLETVMEGKFREGHFNGVAVVVKRLFDICLPHKAYFGMKDFQQLAIIKKLVLKLESDIQIIPCPTIRETDGLAMSSRNTKLNNEQRRQAAIISKCLFDAKKHYKEYTVDALKKHIETQINELSEMKTEYVEIVDDINLQPISEWGSTSAMVVCIAAWAGETRLIDNLSL